MTIEIKEGEIVCLIGANGAGKSTLLMRIFGSPRASSGTILFQGVTVTQVQIHKDLFIMAFPLLQKVVEFFQKCLPLTNLIIAITPKRDIYSKQDFEKIFHLFPILKDRRNQTAGTLSGGAYTNVIHRQGSYEQT